LRGGFKMSDVQTSNERGAAAEPLETVFMFSGQGSQYFQMGRELYEGDATFRGWMLQMDEIARPFCGRSVVAAIYNDGHSLGDPLDRTLLSHPAIFMVEYALAQTLVQAGIRPDLVLGASLGSFAAAAIGGFLSVEDALTAVVRQARVLEECCEPGGMIAVLADPGLFESCLCAYSDLAAVNFSSHFVVSARQQELGEIEAALKRENVGYQRLPVSFAFHSRWIEAARHPFESFMNAVHDKPGDLPMVCCQAMAKVSELPQSYFWKVLRRPVQFRETVKRLEREKPRRYFDLGPSGTLATFLKYELSDCTKSITQSVLTPFGCNRYVLAALKVAHRFLPFHS